MYEATIICRRCGFKETCEFGKEDGFKIECRNPECKKEKSVLRDLVFKQLVKEYEEDYKNYESATNAIDKEHYKGKAESNMNALVTVYPTETSRYLRNKEVTE